MFLDGIGANLLAGGRTAGEVADMKRTMKLLAAGAICCLGWLAGGKASAADTATKAPDVSVRIKRLEDMFRPMITRASVEAMKVHRVSSVEFSKDGVVVEVYGANYSDDIPEGIAPRNRLLARYVVTRESLAEQGFTLRRYKDGGDAGNSDDSFGLVDIGELLLARPRGFNWNAPEDKIRIGEREIIMAVENAYRSVKAAIQRDAAGKKGAAWPKESRWH